MKRLSAVSLLVQEALQSSLTHICSTSGVVESAPQAAAVYLSDLAHAVPLLTSQCLEQLTLSEVLYTGVSKPFPVHTLFVSIGKTIQDLGC